MYHKHVFLKCKEKEDCVLKWKRVAAKCAQGSNCTHERPTIGLLALHPAGSITVLFRFMVLFELGVGDDLTKGRKNVEERMRSSLRHNK